VDCSAGIADTGVNGGGETMGGILFSAVGGADLQLVGVKREGLPVLRYVGQLVPQQSTACRGGRVVLPESEYHVISDRVGQGGN
jgi:hypothetical protein